MELTGKIKVLNDVQNIGSNGFRKREVVITTEEQYPQHILVEFIQDKCDLLDSFNVGQEVKIALNLRGREWINPEGVAKYFNAILGWRIELVNSEQPTPQTQTQQEPVSFLDEADNDLPF
ncbi:DUF3127 domain-containing protein [Winogradskyella undariae]|uniref:DUF3127 domain-containing protein n=1 Tax=Winogradskyella undariae TaxID=1285465 RepID=UPI00156B7B69|nr:DUF3127 domain-containing protein [Winogradskyella undariae]NRR91396.1 DUF3127 domain-containing protein [Winogradskyella undariae]